MEDSIARVNKSQLRGLLHASITRNLIASFVPAGASVVACKVFFEDDRNKGYVKFYKTYYLEAASERIRKAEHIYCYPP